MKNIFAAATQELLSDARSQRALAACVWKRVDNTAGVLLQEQTFLKTLYIFSLLRSCSRRSRTLLATRLWCLRWPCARGLEEGRRRTGRRALK